MNVLIMRFNFLPLSETFIYDEIINGKEEIASYIYYKNRLNYRTFPEMRALPFCDVCDTGMFRCMINDFQKQRFFKNEYFEKSFCNEIARITEVIKTLNVKVIHSHFIEESLFALKLKKYIDIPLIVSLHGGYDSNVFPSVNRKLFLSLMDNVDLCFVRSEYMKERLVEKGVPEKKLSVLYRGVDIDFWQAKTSRVNNDKLNITFIGRFVEKKGLKDAVMAVLPLMQRYRNIIFHIIGGSSPFFYRFMKHILYKTKMASFIEGDQFVKERITLKIKISKVKDRVIYYGMCNREKIREVLQTTDILIAPSQYSKDGDCEGIPGVILEAQALKIPVVTTWHAGIPEVITHELNGMLSPEKDVPGLMRCMEYLITHPQVRMEMGVNGRQIIEQKFNLKDQREKIAKVYLKFN